MYSRNTAFVWIGIILLSGMFLMGQGDSWHPSAPAKVFVSYNTVDGSISFGERVGVAAADALCQAEAWEYGLDGTFRAWISDDGYYGSPATRFGKYGSPYKLPSGVVVADNWEDLTDGFLTNAIDELANSDKIYVGDVWTNTTEYGTAFSAESNAHCNNWLNTTGYTGRHGEITTMDVWWTNVDSDSCSTNKRLYCFQQIPAD